jgi:hypothetical protein
MRGNIFRHYSALIGIIAIRFDSRWRYQGCGDRSGCRGNSVALSALVALQ